MKRQFTITEMLVSESFAPLKGRASRSKSGVRGNHASRPSKVDWTLVGRIRQGLIICSMLLFILLLAPGRAFAASASHSTQDPQVLIAKDVTSSSCSYTITPGNHTRSAGTATAQNSISSARMPCPAGTELELVSVPLSQATANHEANVPPLPLPASAIQEREWEDQVQQVMQAKRNMLRASNNLHPSYTCGWTVDTYGGYHNVFNDNVASHIKYYVASSCSQIFLDTVEVNVGSIPYNNDVWWVEFRYAAYRDTCGGSLHDLFPYSNYSFHPNEYHTAGYYGIYVFQSGAPFCYLGGGSGPITTFGLGPLG